MLRASLFTLLLLLGAVPAFADPFAVSYGGRITDASGNPVQGSVDLRFSFYSGPTTTSEILPPKTIAAVALKDGIFTVKLPLSAEEREVVFASADPWIAVTDLSNSLTFARQRFSAVPYALKVPVDSATLGYDSSGNLYVKGASVSSTFTQGAGQYVGTSEVRARDASGLKVSNSAGQGLFVSDAGGVGIGTNNPAGPLDVGGKLTVLSGGNVGVGTTNPADKLDVAGAARVESLKVGDYLAEKTFHVTFPNGVADQKVDLRLPASGLHHYGWLEVTVGGGHDWGASMGKVTKKYSFRIYDNTSGALGFQETHYSEAFGYAPTHYALSDVSYDSANSVFRIQVVHRSTAGNEASISVKGGAASPAPRVRRVFSTLAESSPYSPTVASSRARRRLARPSTSSTKIKTATLRMGSGSSPSAA